MNNIIDNLQNKKDLTYDHFYNKLMELKITTAVNYADNTVYKTADVKGKGKEPRREPSQKDQRPYLRNCKRFIPV